MTASYPQCRYLRRSGERCTAEAAAADHYAEVLLCVKHLGRAMELVRRHRKEAKKP